MSAEDRDNVVVTSGGLDGALLVLTCPKESKMAVAIEKAIEIYRKIHGIADEDDEGFEYRIRHLDTEKKRKSEEGYVLLGFGYVGVVGVANDRYHNLHRYEALNGELLLPGEELHLTGRFNLRK